ncbi:2-dehydropantoate 2-reductase [Bacillota bacterium]
MPKDKNMKETIIPKGTEIAVIYGGDDNVSKRTVPFASAANEIKTVAIIGLGALGILYGHYFSKKISKENLRIIADKGRIEKYNSEKIYCNGEICDFNFVLPEEATGPADLVLVTVKYNGLAKAIKAIGNQVGENTILISALNGISSEEIIGEAYGMDKIIYSVAQGMDATRVGNSLTYTHMGKLFFGHMDPGAPIEKVRAVADFFDRLGFPYEIDSNMKHRLWGKFMMNVGVNQTAAVYECDYGGLQKVGRPREIMIGAMEEVMVLAGKEGVELRDEDRCYWVGVLDRLNPKGKPSMQQDIEAKRPSEVELFSGTVIALGIKHNIPTPINQMLYKEIKEMGHGNKMPGQG